MRILSALLSALALAGCANSETVRFQAKPTQQAIVRDGQNALVSRMPGSIVLVRPAARQVNAGARVVFVIGMTNITAGPLEFRVANIVASQAIGQQFARLHVYTFEELVQEEKRRQVAAAVLTGLAVTANAVSAASAGRYNETTTVTTPRGTYTATTAGYSPTANYIARANAAADNEALIAATIDRGQQNLAVLEGSIVKDNTLFPGEWYGGKLVLQAPAKSEAGKVYSIVLIVGSDRHEIAIAQDKV